MVNKQKREVEKLFPIYGFENLYLIDINGNIWSNYFHRFIKPFLDNSGYYRVYLAKDKKVYRKLLHRLLAETFIDNPFNLKYINHIDGNKENNNLKNLEWVTSSENQKHAFRLGLTIPNKGESCNLHKLTEYDIIQIKKRLRGGEKSPSIAKDYKVTPGNIRHIRNNKSWRHLDESK